MGRQVADDVVELVGQDAADLASDESVVEPAERDEVLTLFRALEKALNAIQLYPENNKIRLQFIEDLGRRLDSFLEQYQELELTVRDDRFLYCDLLVYSEPNPAKSLSMRLYRDGIRRLTVFKGVTREELKDLLDVIAEQPDPDDLEHDVVTLLWEKDFSHVSYLVFEEIESDSSERDLSKHLKRGDEEGRLKLSPSPVGHQKDKYLAPTLSAAGLSNILTITDHDVGTVKAMIAQENSRNLHHDLMTLLFEMLNLREETKSFRNSVRVLGVLIHSYVRSRRMLEATEVLRKFRDLLHADLEPVQEEIIRDQLAEVGSKETLRTIGGILDQPVVENPDDLVAFMRAMGPDILDGLLDLLPRVRSRHLLTDLLAEFCQEDRDRLLENLNHEDSAVVQQVIQVLGSMSDPSLGVHLRRMLSHQALSVRLEAVKALGKTDGPDATEGLLDAIRDSEHQVRIFALRALNDCTDVALLPTLVHMMEVQTLFQRNQYELQELLCTIAKVGGDRAIPFLKSVLDERSWWRRARNRERRVSAAVALGYIRSVRSRMLLEQGSRSGPAEVREACRMSLLKIDKDEAPEGEAE
ncbi:MAG: HEAT repeat domain-containing protein [Planctomycetota bacterium]|jgi:hypothetical protein